jgi:hypothetical protein
VTVPSAVVTVTVIGTQAAEPPALPTAAPKALVPEDPEVTGSTVMYTVDVDVELNVVVISVEAAAWFP